MTTDDRPDEASEPIFVHGWTIYTHPVFLDQLAALIAEVEARRNRDPDNWHKKNSAKRLAVIAKLIFEAIPLNPGADEFRQGDTLGKDRKHWYRAKFLQQYRLFYRFDTKARIIVLAWVNDDKTLRAYGAKTDAYATFAKMLKGGRPPDSFDDLKKQAQKATGRLAKLLDKWRK